jgi:hypothetical protein
MYTPYEKKEENFLKPARATRRDASVRGAIGVERLARRVQAQGGVGASGAERVGWARWRSE